MVLCILLIIKIIVDPIPEEFSLYWIHFLEFDFLLILAIDLLLWDSMFLLPLNTMVFANQSSSEFGEWIYNMAIYVYSVGNLSTVYQGK